MQMSEINLLTYDKAKVIMSFLKGVPKTYKWETERYKGQ